MLIEEEHLHPRHPPDHALHVRRDSLAHVHRGQTGGGARWIKWRCATAGGAARLGEADAILVGYAQHARIFAETMYQLAGSKPGYAVFDTKTSRADKNTVWVWRPMAQSDMEHEKGVPTLPFWYWS